MQKTRSYAKRYVKACMHAHAFAYAGDRQIWIKSLSIGEFNGLLLN